MTSYLITTLKKGHRFKLTYKNGLFYRLERQKGILTPTELNRIGALIPLRLKDIEQTIERHQRIANYELIKGKETSSKYQDFVAAWMEFYHYEFGMAPNFTGAEGNSLKGIIRYLSKIGGNEQEAFELFRQLLSSYHKLDEFHQQNFDLKYINGNINRIIKNVKQTNQGKSRLSEEFKQKLSKRLRTD